MKRETKLTVIHGGSFERGDVVQIGSERYKVTEVRDAVTVVIAGGWFFRLYYRIRTALSRAFAALKERVVTAWRNTDV
ncbi:MAG TPA: hypothetical protein VGD87_10640 [Archangium sp.]